MKTLQGLRQLALISVVSGVSAWMGAAQASNDGPTYKDGVLRVRRVEFVNKDNELGLVAEATVSGGAISWFVPAPAGPLPADCSTEERALQAWLGSIFKGSIDFTMGSHRRKSTSGFHMSVHGEPERMTMVATQFGERLDLMESAQARKGAPKAK